MRITPYRLLVDKLFGSPKREEGSIPRVFAIGMSFAILGLAASLTYCSDSSTPLNDLPFLGDQEIYSFIGKVESTETIVGTLNQLGPEHFTKITFSITRTIHGPAVAQISVLSQNALWEENGQLRRSVVLNAPWLFPGDEVLVIAGSLPKSWQKDLSKAGYFETYKDSLVPARYWFLVKDTEQNNVGVFTHAGTSVREGKARLHKAGDGIVASDLLERRLVRSKVGLSELTEQISRFYKGR